MQKFKSGYVAIIGKPNSGKSTLLNSLLKQKLSIVTNKPQTTRKRIVGIYTDEDSQIIFLDTPGLLKPDYLLHEKFIDQIKLSINDADIVLVLIDCTDRNYLSFFDFELIENLLLKKKNKLFVVINKIDLAKPSEIKRIKENLNARFPKNTLIEISALQSINTDSLLNELKKSLPVGPKYFPEEQLAEENERFFVSEIIREKIFEQFSDEIPFSTEVIVEDYKEREKNKDYISAIIVVEKESQKPIIIGKNGEAIKKIGKSARQSIEEFIGKEVYLELRVKVKPKWRNDNNALKTFGYNLDSDI